MPQTRHIFACQVISLFGSLVCLPFRTTSMSPSTAGAVFALDMDFPFCALITTSCHHCSDTAPHTHIGWGCLELPAWAVPPLWVWMRTSSLISSPCNKTDSIRSTSLHPPELNSPHRFNHLLIFFLPGNLLALPCLQVPTAALPLCSPVCLDP